MMTPNRYRFMCECTKFYIALNGEECCYDCRERARWLVLEEQRIARLNAGPHRKQTAAQKVERQKRKKAYWQVKRDGRRAILKAIPDKISGVGATQAPKCDGDTGIAIKGAEMENR